MTRERWTEYADQLETSLKRAESAKKDRDLIILLRMAREIAEEHIRREDKKNGK